VDVGGGHGSLIAEILRATPGLQGVVFDRPEVIETAKFEVQQRGSGIADRCQLVAGDFFESVPEADAYIMKYIIHDWDDDRCVKILSNCRRALRTKGKALVVDTVVPPGNDPHWSKLLDVNMLVLTGGRERTQNDFAQLFARAGLSLQRVVPTACPLSVIEAIPASWRTEKPER
jgi:ubiquinone/menaquinone biosynthesis C-methylase UbiE